MSSDEDKTFVGRPPAGAEPDDSTNGNATARDDAAPRPPAQPMRPPGVSNTGAPNTNVGKPAALPWNRRPAASGPPRPAAEQSIPRQTQAIDDQGRNDTIITGIQVEPEAPEVEIVIGVDDSRIGALPTPPKSASVPAPKAPSVPARRSAAPVKPSISDAPEIDVSIDDDYDDQTEYVGTENATRIQDMSNYPELAASRNDSSDSPSRPVDVPMAHRPSYGPVTVRGQYLASRYPKSDPGALAAVRTMRTVKRKAAFRPLVGTDPDVVRSRYELLISLAQSVTGRVRSNLLVSAAGIMERAGDAQAARSCLEDAHRSDPTNLGALRRLRGYLLAASEWQRAASLYEAEANHSAARGEAYLALVAASELYIHNARALDHAEQLLRRALKLRPDGIVAHLLLTECLLRLGRARETFDILSSLANHWSDRRISAAICADAARAAELRGSLIEANTLFKRALQAYPHFENTLGHARTARALGQNKVLAENLERAEAAAETPELRSELNIYRACFLWRAMGDLEAARKALRPAETARAVMLAAQLACEGKDLEHQLDALRQAAEQLSGADRALLLAKTAETYALMGEARLARDALKEATLVDASSVTAQVARAMVDAFVPAQRELADPASSDTHERRADTVLRACANAATSDKLNDEYDLLRAALSTDERAVAADVLFLDAALALSQYEEALPSLARDASRSSKFLRAGAYIALRELVGANEGLRQAAYEAAGELLSNPTDSLAVLRLHAWEARNEPATAAGHWLKEAAATSGPQAAAAAVLAARLRSDLPDEAAKVYQYARELDASYAPAAWALEHVARMVGNIALLRELHESTAGTVDDPVEAASRFLRAGLLCSLENTVEAAELFRRALALRPTDTIAQDLLVRLAHSLEPGDGAPLVEQVAAVAPDVLKPIYLARAAVLYEEHGDHGKAFDLYHSLHRTITALPAADILSIAATRALRRSASSKQQYLMGLDLLRRKIEQPTDAVSSKLALEALALPHLWLHPEYGDAVIDSLRRIRQRQPDSLPILRALERTAMTAQADADLVKVELALAQTLDTPADARAHLYVAYFRWLKAGQLGDLEGERERVLMEQARSEQPDLWLLRRLEALARKSGHPQLLVEAYNQLFRIADRPEERALLVMRMCELAPNSSATLKLIADEHEIVSQHSLAAEVCARTLLTAGDLRGAAEHFERSASSARSTQRSVRLWHEAGLIWEDQLQDTERAATAFTQAVKLDPLVRDAFPRTRHLLAEQGRADDLEQLIHRRIEAGGPPSTIAELYHDLAELRERKGDRAGTIACLESILQLRPTDRNSLRWLAQLLIDEGEWSRAAEQLERLTKVSTDRKELAEVYFALGELYEAHISDMRRARGAFQAALELNPTDRMALARLAQMHRLAGERAEAQSLYLRLLQVSPELEAQVQYRLDLAQLLMEGEHAKEAESILDEARRLQPANRQLIAALADLYRSQNAPTALNIHLDRAARDVRASIQNAPQDPMLWRSFIDVLVWRDRIDAARCCASLVQVLGLSDPELDGQVAQLGLPPALESRAAAREIDDLIAPPAVSFAVRHLFQLAEPVFDKLLAFDVRSHDTEKLSPRRDQLARRAQEIGIWFGLPDVEVYATSSAPQAFIPVQVSPTGILVGRELIDRLSVAETDFLLCRALKIAQSHFTVAVRSRRDDLRLVLSALGAIVNPHSVPMGFDPNAYEDLSRRLQRALPKRTRDEILSVAMDVWSSPDFDPRRLPAGVSELGDRAALLAIASAPAAFDALLKLAGAALHGASETTRIERLLKIGEARELFHFAYSDLYFDTRNALLKR